MQVNLTHIRNEVDRRIMCVKCVITKSVILIYFILLADRTNGRAIATLLRLSSVVCDVMYCG